MFSAPVISSPELGGPQDSRGFWIVRHTALSGKEKPELASSLTPVGGDQTKPESKNQNKL
jgi:hypothetical protein